MNNEQGTSDGEGSWRDTDSACISNLFAIHHSLFLVRYSFNSPFV